MAEQEILGKGNHKGIQAIQSTSSILLSSFPSSSNGGISTSSPSTSSSSMLRPSFSILWILAANVFGSSRLKPDVSRAVSKSRSTKSFTDLSFLSASALFLSSSMIPLSGLISIVFLLDIPKVNWIADEFRMLLHEEESDFGSSAQLLTVHIPGNSERATSLRLPNVLLVVIVLGCHNDFLSNQVSRVKPNTKLSDHAHVSPGLQCLHEFFSPRPCNSSQIVHQI
ncbi:hypothetical protein F8388_026857 [Cannabis sativa]|uniref:Uncharacterized protein n=1 Tax=Cannabis sativa TaxID=3483 RepID=A0A7J6H2N6_CANSA|nr:hypothetical protein F8388_026857 [Cannabis sativa]